MKRFLPIGGLLLSGVLFIFCFPKWNMGGWLAWVALVPLLWGAAGLSGSGSFLWGTVSGLLANLGTLYWIYSTCRWGGVNPVVSALALFSLSFYLALYWGVFASFARKCPGHHWSHPFLNASAWVSLEFLRTHLFTGFPWLLMATSQWKVPKHLPLAEWGGAYAVSFLLLLFNGTILLFIRKHWKTALPALGALVGLTVWSVFLWRRGPAEPPDPPKAAVVQANIDQYKKWDDAYVQEIVTSYDALTRRAAVSKPALIVWPETAVPGWIPNDAQHLRWVSSQARDAKTFLLFGAVSRQENRDYNAAFLLSPEGRLLGNYRKQHLVPFGEYAPFQRFFGMFSDVLNALGAFDAGKGATVLSGPVSLGVGICFEGLFPNLMRQFTREGAEVLVNLTNDGWYRDTAGPEQHFAANVLRAVENRRWLIRAANTGISGFVSPRGEVLSTGALLTSAVIEGPLCPLSGWTFYVRWGDVFSWFCVCLSCFSMGAWRRKKT